MSLPTDAATPRSAGEPWLEVSSSAGFSDWLAEHRVSLAFTTYQTSKLFVIGRLADGRLSVVERTFNRCMGLWGDGQTLWMSSQCQIWRFVNVLRPGAVHEGYDRLYLPKTAHTTGYLDVHDLALDSKGRLVFVVTMFGCLGGLSERFSFTPLWRPPFLTGLAAEDRCHLNGLAMDEGRVRFVTAVSRTDTAEGWRDHRRDGGCVLEVPSGRVVASGLSMPHSPRVYHGRLWLLNSGTGIFGSVDPRAGNFTPVTFCPGYLRGLAFAGDYAIVGLSRPRRERAFEGLALDEELARRNVEPTCGLYVIDLRSGETAHWLRLGGVVNELYDVVVLPGVTRPTVLGMQSDEVERTIAVGDEGKL